MSLRSQVQQETRAYRVPARVVEAVMDALQGFIHQSEVTYSAILGGDGDGVLRIEVVAPADVLNGIDFWMGDRAESRLIRDKKQFAKLLRKKGPLWRDLHRAP